MMKKNAILLSCFLLCANTVTAEDEVSGVDSLSAALTQGTFKVLLRYSGQYRGSNLHVLQDSATPDISDEKKQQYSALGGYLGYETAPWFNTSVGATFYTSNPFGNNPDDRMGLGGLYEENGEQESYNVIGEAFVKLQYQGHLVKAGRQEMPDYRFVSLSNVRMTPLTHQGAVYENTVFDQFQVNLAYITKMKERNAEKFIDMAEASRLKVSSSGKQLIRGAFNPGDYDDSGYIGDKKEMSMASMIYGPESLVLEGWDYYVDDFVNTFYLYSQYDIKTGNSDLMFSLAAQYANQQDVGDQIAGNIDTWFYGLRLQAYAQGLTAFISYNEVDYNENSYDGGTIFVRWGTPQMFNSFQVQDSELAGIKSYGVGVQYKFGTESVIPGVVMRLRYADYDLPNKLSQTDARQDRTETTFDLNYAFRKGTGFAGISNLEGLSIQFRLAYDRYETDYDFEEYQARHGYTFDNVNDDFIDARLYLDYQF